MMKSKRSISAVIIFSFIAFISLALPDGLLGVAWPSIRNDFSRSLDSLGMLLIASTSGYLASSFFSGYIVSRIGVGRLLSFSCTVTGLGLIGYTLAPYWGILVLLAVFTGAGAGAIDAGLNIYASSHFSERIMQWLHASYGIGITLGPFLMTAGINLFYSWALGYIIVGIFQLVLALSFGISHKIWDEHTASIRHNKEKIKKTSLSETLRHPEVWFSILLFFIYSGIEASLGYWSYTLLTESRGVSPGIAGIWVGGYWGTFTIGRIAAGIISSKIRMHSLILLCLFLALSGGLLLVVNPFFHSSLIGISVIGFAIAPIFPGMVSLTGRRVRPMHTANTVGMQIAAAGIGNSLIPSVYGFIAQRTSLEAIPLLVLINVVLLLLFYWQTGRK